METLHLILFICLHLFLCRIGFAVFQYQRFNKNSGTPVHGIKKLTTGIILTTFLVLFVGEMLLQTQLHDSLFKGLLASQLSLHPLVAIVGVFFSILSVVALFMSLSALGKSLRFGLTAKNKGTLVTSGIFRYSRNPFFLSFLLLFGGVALILPTAFFISIAVCSFVVIHIYVLKEERFMRKHYGKNYVVYSRKVRRYF